MQRVQYNSISTPSTRVLLLPDGDGRTFLMMSLNQSDGDGRTFLIITLNQPDESTLVELLPSEIVCLILNAIPNMKTLSALLRASPRCFRVYRTCRELILPRVVWNQITHAILPIALDALQQRENRKFRLYRTELYSSQRTPKEPQEILLGTWKRLHAFHEIVDFFILAFTKARLAVLEDTFHPQSRDLSLSDFEYARLARAFYNLDLYSHLFYDLIPLHWTVGDAVGELRAKGLYAKPSKLGV